jgi:hypothetical protein
MGNSVVANDAAGMNPASSGNELMNCVVGEHWPHGGMHIVVQQTEVEIVASALAVIRSPFTNEGDFESW